MSEFTREDAAAFIESMRLTLGDKVGFRWLSQKLDSLARFVDDLCLENDRMRAYIEGAGNAEEYARFLADAATRDEGSTPNST